jgi:predicted metalloprotease
MTWRAINCGGPYPELVRLDGCGERNDRHIDARGPRLAQRFHTTHDGHVDVEERKVELGPPIKGLHSSTSQLNLSRFGQ